MKDMLCVVSVHGAIACDSVDGIYSIDLHFYRKVLGIPKIRIRTTEVDFGSGTSKLANMGR